MIHFKKAIVIGTAAIASLAAVTGAALASGRSAKAPARSPIAVVKSVDTDNVQEGDQNSPDTANAAPEAVSPAAAVAKPATSGKASPSKATDGSDESENSGESENAGESDGPGGHEDPQGQDVNHDFNGEE